MSGLLIVGEKGNGDGYGIGSPETYTVLEIAKMFDGEVQILPERKGNRMTSEVITQKTEALGWKAKKHIKDFIEEIKK